jgi:hypothetical protein
MIGVLQIKVIRQIGKIMVETWVVLRPRRALNRDSLSVAKGL